MSKRFGSPGFKGSDLELRCSKHYLGGDSAIAFKSANSLSNLPPIILSMLINRQNALPMKFFSPVTVTLTSVSLPCRLQANSISLPAHMPLQNPILDLTH